MENAYSVKAAIRYAKENRIDEWVDSFLRAKNGNIELANGLKKQKRYWFGPEQHPLRYLKRCCGPEKGMEYHESVDVWTNRIDILISSIYSGNELPPLIVHYTEGELSVRDGNHRYEAYVKSGLCTCWIIVWFDSESDKELFEQKYHV